MTVTPDDPSEPATATEPPMGAAPNEDVAPTHPVDTRPAPPDATPTTTPSTGRRRHLQAVDQGHRAPPHHLDAEEALLGAMLIKPAAIDMALGEGLAGNAFYKPSHGAIYDAIITLHGQGQPTDTVTVAAYLIEHGDMDRVGGPAILLALQAATPATSNAWKYARLIVEAHQLRTGIANLNDAVDRFYDYDQAGALHHLQQAVEQAAPTGITTHSWQPVDLDTVLDGDLDEPATMLKRNDGVALLYPAKVNAFNAESEAGKSMIACQACAEQIWAGGHAGYIDFEDTAKGIAGRLLDMGVTRDELLERFHYIRPDDPLDLTAVAHLTKTLQTWPLDLVVIDGVTEVMVMNGWEINDTGDTARFYAALPRRIAVAGPGVLLIDHVPKDKERRGKGGVGSQHKRAGIDGAGYIVEVISPFGRGLDGQVRLTVDKDRPGAVRPHSAGGKHAADVRILTTPNGLEVHVDAPPRSDASSSAWDGPTQCMAALERFFADRPTQTLGKTKVAEQLRALGMSYRDKTISDALERLALGGYLAAVDGPRASRLFTLSDGAEGTDGATGAGSQGGLAVDNQGGGGSGAGF